MNPTSRPSRPALAEPLAIFDLDRTLHAGSGLGVLAKHAFKRRLIGPQRMARSLAHDVVYRRRGSTDGHTSAIAELALEMVRGVALDELSPIVTATAEHIASSVRPQMRRLLDDHLVSGHQLVLLSASPQLLVQEIAGLLDVHHGIGTLIEEDEQGILTGRIVQPMCYGPGKLERLDRTLGRPDAVASAPASFAYADSMSDLPLLESVDNPVVVSPDRKLRRIADERQWPVLEV